MATTARNWRLAALALATATMIGVVGIASPARATHDDDGEVTVTSAGDPANPVTLSTTPNVGDAARLTRVVDSMVTAEAPEMSMSLDGSSQTHVQRHIAVQSVQPDGEYAALTTVESFDQTVDDRFGMSEDMVEFFPADLTPLVGVALVQHFDADGVLEWSEPAPGTTLTAEQDDAVDALRTEAFDFPLIAPDTPVGQGATWVLTAPDAVADFLPFAIDYELVSVKDDRFVVDMSFEMDLTALGDTIGMPPELDELSGQMTGGARFSGVLNSPLLTSTSFTLRMDIAMSAEGVDLTMTVDYAVDETAYPA